MMLLAKPAASSLRGRLRPPGDKSISHRAVIFAGLARGSSRISGWLDSADVRATVGAMRQLGAKVREVDGELLIEGTADKGLAAQSEALDMGNSGTAMRLLAGVLAGQPHTYVLTGDHSLNARPMRRIIRPLEMMGARIEAGTNDTAPLTIHGSGTLQAIDYVSPVASAQVKSCVLLAGLFADGVSSVQEPRLSRDHTERLLPVFGVELAGPCAVRGGSRLQGATVQVPADPSSAAFPAVAAALTPGSEVTLEGVGLNETRTAFYKALQAMGGDVNITVTGKVGEEPVGTIRVRHAEGLKGIDLPQEWIPAMIDEVPALLALAARARGTTRIRGAAELRVKESDRLAVMSAALRRLGIDTVDYDDGIDVAGGAPVAARVDANDDHRCAMSLAALAQVMEGGLEIGGAGYIDTSYPGFAGDMASLGAGPMAFGQ
jgi:3-phosphoshikimate 1-carboxyvinyltransferase